MSNLSVVRSDLAVRRRACCRTNPYQYLIVPGVRLLYLSEFKDFPQPVSSAPDRFHHPYLALAGWRRAGGSLSALDAEPLGFISAVRSAALSLLTKSVRRKHGIEDSVGSHHARFMMDRLVGSAGLLSRLHQVPPVGISEADVRKRGR